MLRRISKSRHKQQQQQEAVEQSAAAWAITIPVATSLSERSQSSSSIDTVLAGERKSSSDDRQSYNDVPTPPASPKLSVLANSGEVPMTRDQRIAMLLARAAPRKELQNSASAGRVSASIATPQTAATANGVVTNGLERGSSFPARKAGSIKSLELSKVDAGGSNPSTVSLTTRTLSNGEDQSPSSSPRKRAERSSSFTQCSPRLSTTVTAIASSMASPRGPPHESNVGGKKVTRRDSYSGTTPDFMPHGTLTRIIYFQSPIAVLEPPKVYLVPNEVITEGMRAVLTQAHMCEFGIGRSDTGENEVELKAGAIHLIDRDTNYRHKMLIQHDAQVTGVRGMLLEYVQQAGAADTNIAKTTITHEYIFKNAV